LHGENQGLQRAATLRDYLQVVRRRKWVIAQAVVLVPLAAVAFSLHQQSRYQCTSEVLLSRQNLANALTGAQDPTVYVQADRVAQTQAEVARVPGVAAAALRRVRGSGLTADGLLATSSVNAQQNADLLVFKVANHIPQLACRLADAYAGAYTTYRRQLDTAAIVSARKQVAHRLGSLDRRSAEYANLVERDQQLATMQALLTAQAHVVQQADNAVRVQPKPTRNGILGLALGVVLGLGLAFLWEALDTRVRSAAEIGEKLGGLPLLTRVPEPSRRLRAANELVMLADPTGVHAETFRMLRTNLDFATLDRDVSTVMVTSAVEQEGKSTTIANLAVALARAGKRVIVADLDLRRPFLHKFFRVHGPGVTQVALGHASLDSALVPVAITEPGFAANGNGRRRLKGILEVLPAGPIPPDPGEFVGTQALADILDELRDRADLVLIDAPPVLRVGDAMTLSAKVDGIIVVTRMQVVRRQMLAELARQLAHAPARKLGFVATGAGEEQTYDGYGYGRYYASAYEQAEVVR
jgi:succinoglycan biosynthesis transport protein ExoP